MVSLSITYWFVTVFLIVAGFFAGFSIGQPFFYFGVVMLLVAPLRRYRAAFLSLLVGFGIYLIVYFAFAPFSCTASATEEIIRKGEVQPIEASRTVCTSLIGIQYEGDTGYPHRPSQFAGLISGATAGLVTFYLVRRKDGTQNPPENEGPGKVS